MKARVNKIIPFSSVDGPGNRTAIFLQGCNINCLYCHNPETRDKYGDKNITTVTENKNIFRHSDQDHHDGLIRVAVVGSC